MKDIEVIRSVMEEKRKSDGRTKMEGINEIDDEKFNWPSKSTLQSCMLGPGPAGFLLTGRSLSRCIALTAQDKVNVFAAFQKFNNEGALTLVQVEAPRHRRSLGVY